MAKLAREDGLPREALWLQTKFTPERGQDPRRLPYDLNAPLAEQVEQSIQKSLQNLGTHYIDSLVLHSPMPTLEDTLVVWSVFERAVDSGIVRQLGISNCYSLDFLRALHRSARIKPRVLQNRFYSETSFDGDVRKICLDQGITYQTFWTLSANPHILDSMPVRRAATRLRATPAQVLFRWLIQSGHQPLTGTKSSIHMEQDLAVTNMTLTDSEMIEIGRLLR